MIFNEQTCTHEECILKSEVLICINANNFEEMYLAGNFLVRTSPPTVCTLPLVCLPQH